MQAVDNSGLILPWWLKKQLERIASQVMSAGDWTCQAHLPRCDPFRGRRRCRAQDPGVALVPHATPG